MIEQEQETAAQALQSAVRKHDEAVGHAIVDDPAVTRLWSERHAAYERIAEIDSALRCISRMTNAQFGPHTPVHSPDLPVDSPWPAAISALATDARREATR
jgi:hypothetical protein